MNLLYNLGIKLYACGVKIAAASGNGKARLMAEGHKRVLGDLATLPADARPIWVHAASLGEFEQGRPLIERIRRELPGRPVLLTFFSPSGYEVRKGYDKADVVTYLPLDTPARVRRFLDAARPSMAIMVKYEFWGNYLQELRRRAIPTYLISAIFRPEQAFFKPWGGTFRSMLRCYTHIFVQDDNSRKLLHGVGCDNVTVAGDTRFDRVTDIMRAARDFPDLREFAASQPTLLMGSSWPADEDVVIPYFNAHADAMRLIIAPHEFDEERLRALIDRIDGKTVRYSRVAQGLDDIADARCVIIDSFGILSSCYRYAAIAYVGGGFGAGIHNINEAAVYGIPVLFGPRHDKFKEATDLIACGGAFEVTSAQSLAERLSRLLSDDAARAAAGAAAGAYVNSCLGATDRIFSAIFPR